MAQINASIGFDKRLAAHDLAGSQAHARMLAATGVITEAERDAILDGLERIEAAIEAGTFAFTPELEDIHLNIEQRLTDLVGEPGRRLHTARSRNDQVATDFKLWVRDAMDRADALLAELQRVLLGLARQHAATVMPGFTHLQAAQPVTFGHHLLAYVEMLGRDRSRFADARRRLNECPLGAAALAGTSFPIDRAMTAAELGFDRPTANSIDAVSDRDFALDYLAGGRDLRRPSLALAEELVLWSTPQFGFVRMPEAFTSGSSIMPQKRNPDAAELVRGKSGRILGAPAGAAGGAQGPAARLFQGHAGGQGGRVRRRRQPRAVPRRHGRDAGRDAGLPGADAGRRRASATPPPPTSPTGWCASGACRSGRRTAVAARVVRLAEERGCGLEELTLTRIWPRSIRGSRRVPGRVLAVDSSVASRRSFGGTAPERVRAAADEAERRFLGGR